MITIIGNGESRKVIDINKINHFKVGCNGIYLHNSVDLICAMDKFWRDKIIKESNIPLISRLHNNSFQATVELYDNGWKDTKCMYRGYCSGITALDYMSDLYKEDFYLIGFDFDYIGTKVNHVYKDTPNHPNSNRPAQNENIFLKQFLETVKRYPLNNYFWVNNNLNFLIKIKQRNLFGITIKDYEELAYKE